MRLTLVAIFLISSVWVFAQKQTVSGIKLHYGTIFIHTKSVKNVAGAKPYGAEVEFSKEPLDSSSFNKCNCFARNGVALSYFNLDNRILGYTTMVSYFLEPSYKINRDLQFILRGAAGLTYAGNPFNATKNPENKNYTTHINPYLQVGIGLGYNAGKHVKMQLMSSLQHFSNGAFKEPNRGVNWITASLGILYYSQTTHQPNYKRNENKFIKKKVAIDAGIFYVPRQGYNSKVMEQSEYVYGIFTQATKQYGRISAITGGIEIYQNKIKNQSGYQSRSFAGIHAGHAFIFGKVIFSQQAGINIYNKTSGVEDFYFRYGLLYRISKHITAGINLKAYQDNADFTDFRVMYSL